MRAKNLYGSLGLGLGNGSISLCNIRLICVCRHKSSLGFLSPTLHASSLVGAKVEEESEGEVGANSGEREYDRETENNSENKEEGHT